MLKPLGNRVIIKTVEADGKTAGGIIIPDNVRERPQEGEILAVGADCQASDLIPGARVLFGKYSGTPIKHEGAELLIMREDELICLIQ
jgi:chaperonin GroES